MTTRLLCALCGRESRESFRLPRIDEERYLHGECLRMHRDKLIAAGFDPHISLQYFTGNGGDKFQKPENVAAIDKVAAILNTSGCKHLDVEGPNLVGSFRCLDCGYIETGMDRAARRLTQNAVTAAAPAPSAKPEFCKTAYYGIQCNCGGPSCSSSVSASAARGSKKFFG